MVLVNGSAQTMTGCTSFVPRYNPKDIIDNIKRLLNGDTIVEMKPWYKWFKGGSNDVPLMEEFEADASELSERLLNTTLGLCIHDMNLIDSHGALKQYYSSGEILCDFYRIRLGFYSKRKEALLSELKKELDELEEKIRYRRELAAKTIEVYGRRKEEVIAQLKDKGYKPSRTSPGNPIIEGREYDYLLEMNNLFVAFDEDRLLAQRDDKKHKYEMMTPQSIWLADIRVLEGELDRLDIQEKRDLKCKRDSGKASRA